MHNQIPFSTHGSNCANRALAMGVNVANAAEATLHLLSAIATATLGVDVRNAFRMEAGAERPNDHLEETQTFATEADVDSVSGTISTANQFIRRSSRLRRPRYRPRRRYPRPDGLRSVRAGKRHRASRSHVTETGVDSSRAACET